MYRRLFSLPADGDNQGAVDTALHALLDEWLASEKAVLRSSAAAKASSSSLSSSLKGTASAGVDASASGSGATGVMNDDDDAIERRPICGHVFRKGETIYRCR